MGVAVAEPGVSSYVDAEVWAESLLVVLESFDVEACL